MCLHENTSPIFGWHGRYRCTDCGAICYKRWAILPVDLDEYGRPELAQRGPLMSHYVCQIKGCTNPAVTKETIKTRKAWRCAEHRKENKPDEENAL